MPSFAAYLRVYEPLAAFPDAVRGRWRAYAAAGHGVDRAAGMAAEHDAGLAAPLAVVARGAPDPSAEPPAIPDGAFVARAGGVTYVCPWDLPLRWRQAVARLRRELPAVVADALVPPALVRAAQGEHATAVPHILTSTWRVPLPWFLLFEQAERRLVLGPRRVGARDVGARQIGGTRGRELTRALVYLTPMARARRRLARGLAVLRRTVDTPGTDGGALVGEVTELGAWLEEFHPHALVELDYGQLVHLLDDDELRADDSVAAVAEGLRALDEGRTSRALAAYRTVSKRWRSVAKLGAAN